MSWLSSLKNFVFDNVLAAASRSASSVNPTAQSIGAAAIAAVTPIAAGALVTAGNDLNAHKSPVGLINDVVGTAETALKAAIDAYAEATIGTLPVIGGFLAPEAVSMANNALDFGEQHFLTYVSALFGYHSAAVNTPAPTNNTGSSFTGFPPPQG